MSSLADSLPADLPDTAGVAEAMRRLGPWIARAGAGDRLLEILPRVPDPGRALASLESLIAANEEPGEDLLEPLLRVLGSSQTLASTLVAVPGGGLDWLRQALAIGEVPPADHVGQILREAGAGGPETIPAALRRHKRRHVLRIGARDLLGLASVVETTREISALAEGAIEVAVRYARSRAEQDYGGFASEDRLRFTVLAMGKLGGGELNFSSDIDLVYLYDGGAGASAGGPRGSLPGHAWAAKVSETVTRALSERTDDGVVFRVDLRLRPDGQNGPIVNSLPAALLYYESWGQVWERAAMLKARPVGGDLELGDALLGELRPFVYRRYLDYGTIEEIEDMKARVQREHSRSRLDRDVKLGPGGIRDVEFIVQVLQLVHGGRDERLRVRPTLEALSAIARVGVIDPAEANDLANAYRFLRDVEHKIQIVHERQTQLLPEDPASERLLARRLGLHLVDEPVEPSETPPETQRLRRRLERHRAVVGESFAKLFFEARERRKRPADDAVSTLLQGLDDPEATARRLGGMEFRDPATAAANLRLLRDGPSRSPVSARRRKALLDLAPSLLSEIRKTSEPDLALHHMAEFISAVGARTSFLVLLNENPETLRLLVGLFASSRYLSSFFLRHPELLDSLVRADLAMVHKDRTALDADLASLLDATSDHEEELDALRRFRNEEFLRIGVNDIHGLLDFSEVTEQLSDLAESCLGAALRIAAGILSQRFGSLPGRFAVIAMGKLGGRELNYNSDLDLIFIYDAPEEKTAATISIHEYFTKLAQRLMATLQLNTREGYVYKIDTRLRPSGASGALVSSLDAYRHYHETSSAIWERQALIRARGVAGDASLIANVESVNEGFVYGKSIEAEHVEEIARLRSRMELELARESASRWNLKTGRGGIVDVEFLVQMLQLRHGHAHPRVRVRRTERALEALLAEGLLAEDEYRTLHEGYRFLRRLENSLRIERDQPVEALEHEAAGVIARRLGYTGDPESAARELLAELDRVRESVRESYERNFR